MKRSLLVLLYCNGALNMYMGIQTNEYYKLYRKINMLNVISKWKCQTEYKFDVVITIVTGYVLMTNI